MVDDEKMDISDSVDVQKTICHKIYKYFEGLEGTSDFKMEPLESDEVGEYDLSFSFEQSKTFFKVLVLSTPYFKLIRIINAFDFTANKSIKDMNLLDRANQFNAYAIGIKSLIHTKEIGYIDFCVDFLSDNGDMNVKDLELSLVLLKSAPMNFLAVTTD